MRPVLFLSCCYLCTAALPQRVPLRIVHLGDSYSSGNGARDENNEENYHGVSKCKRSPTSWGNQFAASLGDAFAVTYINRACSGSTLEHLTQRRQLELHFSCPTPIDDEVVVPGCDGACCRRFVRPQIDAVDGSVDLVIMTISGNDLGFGTTVMQCFVVGLRDEEDCRRAVEEGNDRLPRVLNEIVVVLMALRARLRSDAKVVLVAYPHMVLEDAPYSLGDFDAAAGIRELAAQLDAAQAKAVEQANLEAGEDFALFYDDTKKLFHGHEPHPSALTSNPDRWLFELADCPWFPPSDCYHFNPEGHRQLAVALSAFQTFGAAAGPGLKRTNVDLALVIDTTGSMRNDISQVRRDVASLVAQLERSTSTFRVAVVSYRDFPERTGSSLDYPSRVDQDFTANLAQVQAAMDSMIATGGGDGPESVFSGIKAALDLAWRPGVTKIATVIGDAPPLVIGGAEPISGLTSSQIVAQSIALDPVETIALDRGSLATAELESVVVSTGGSTFDSSTDLTVELQTVINTSAQQPHAWFGTAVAGKVGQAVAFDASGSFDPTGEPLSLYEWDFDGDGTYDFASDQAFANFTYGAAYDGFVVLRVTGSGGRALASTPTRVNLAGSVPQDTEEDPCELDEEGFSIVILNGSLLDCNATHLRPFDKPGVIVLLAVTSSSTTSSSSTETNTTTTSTSTETNTTTTSTSTSTGTDTTTSSSTSTETNTTTTSTSTSTETDTTTTSTSTSTETDTTTTSTSTSTETNTTTTSTSTSTETDTTTTSTSTSTYTQTTDVTTSSSTSTVTDSATSTSMSLTASSVSTEPSMETSFATMIRQWARPSGLLVVLLHAMQ